MGEQIRERQRHPASGRNKLECEQNAHLTNEMAGTGGGPKVDSSGEKFQVYFSHSGKQKPKNGGNVDGDTQKTVNAQGGRVKLRSCVDK